MFKRIPLSIVFFCVWMLFSFNAFSQHQLKIITHLDKSFDSYTVTIYDTSNVEFAKYRFYTPDTTITYSFDSTKTPKFVYVMLSGHMEANTYFNVANKVPLKPDSVFTTYHLQQLSKKQINFYKNKFEHPYTPPKVDYTKKQSGLFNKKSPSMWCVGYAYQQSHLINLEYRKTGVDISGSHNDGLYGISLLYAPYILAGGDLMVSPDIQFAPKAGIGVYFLIVNANLSFIEYNTNFKTFDPAVLPEVGLSSPFGLIHIDYGYNFYLNKLDNRFNKSNQRISLRFTWYLNPDKVW